MRKKWLIAVFVSENEKLLKAKQFPLSSEATDISTPNNTLFYFFSNTEINMDVTEFQMSENTIMAVITTMCDSIPEKKLYCEGTADGKSIIVKGARNEYRLESFIELVEKSGLKVIFV